MLVGGFTGAARRFTAAQACAVSRFSRRASSAPPSLMDFFGVHVLRLLLAGRPHPPLGLRRLGNAITILAIEKISGLCPFELFV